MNVVYTMTQGVFQTFRRRLTTKDALAFANILPVPLKALFVTDWDPDEEILPFVDKAEMNEEVNALRSQHSFSSDTAIEDVAKVLLRHVNKYRFELVLSELPKPAAEFWSFGS